MALLAPERAADDFAARIANDTTELWVTLKSERFHDAARRRRRASVRGFPRASPCVRRTTPSDSRDTNYLRI